MNNGLQIIKSTKESIEASKIPDRFAMFKSDFLDATDCCEQLLNFILSRANSQWTYNGVSWNTELTSKVISAFQAIELCRNDPRTISTMEDHGSGENR